MTKHAEKQPHKISAVKPQKAALAETNGTAGQEMKKYAISTKDAVKKGSAKKKSTAKAKTQARYTTVHIHFLVRYHSRFGESLFVTGDHELLGNNDPEKAFPLEFLNEENWSGTIDVTEDALRTPITYNYLLKNADGTFTQDWGNDKKITEAFLHRKDVQLNDAWNHAGFAENVFYTEPFQNILLSDHSVAHKKAAETKHYTHIFKCKAPLLQKNEVLCLLGNDQLLKNWNEKSPILLDKPETSEAWEIELNLTNAGFPLVYKYGVYNVKEKKFVQYEQGNNRILYDAVGKHRLSIVNDGFAQLPVNTWKGAGIAIPVFSLRSEKSLGVGEFSDLKLLADWAKETGLKLIQILPVNDTSATHTWTDSYPYSAISAFALHPLYLHVEKLIDKKDKALVQKIKAKRIEFNQSPTLRYEEVMNFKLEVLQAAFNTVQATVFTSKPFIAFFEENKHWLVAYAAFCYLRDKNKSADFNTWKEHAVYDEAAIQKLSAVESPAYDEISFHYFVQFHLHLQLKDAVSHAHEQGVILKGDIPIGIYRSSVDAWQQPELYKMEMQSGAPPDDFAVKGQNWGFPIYNWKRMQEDGFSWWKQRFEQMSRYFDAFRIDHILGFFRIWSIPMDAVEGIMGRFIPAIPIHVNEFNRENIYFDYNRYCKPFINEEVLQQTGNGQQEELKEKFLTYDGFGNYTLKPEFDTQRKVETYFLSLPDNERHNALRSALYDLISNVILFEEKGSNGQHFHFRFDAHNTASFKQLDGHTQYLLKNLYDDYFFKRQDDFWKKEALNKLPALKRATNMLVCGEDLGMVPACVPDVMRNTGLLSLEIQRMPKDPKRIFFHPADAPYLSVVTPSTHDMSTIRGWWEEDRKRTQQFFNNELGQWGDASFFCEPWVAKSIILQHMHSPAMWSIFQLQDLLAMDGKLRRDDPHEERINDPANAKHFWQYRMHLTIEELSEADHFNAELKEMVKGCGR